MTAAVTLVAMMGALVGVFIGWRWGGIWHAIAGFYLGGNGLAVAYVTVGLMLQSLHRRRAKALLDPTNAVRAPPETLTERPEAKRRCAAGGQRR